MANEMHNTKLLYMLRWVSPNYVTFPNTKEIEFDYVLWISYHYESKKKKIIMAYFDVA